MRPLFNRAACGLAGLVIGAGLAGGAVQALPSFGGVTYPQLGPAAGLCVTGAVTEVITHPCGYGMLSGLQYNAGMEWLGSGIAQASADIQAGQGKEIAAMGKLANGQVARRNQTTRNQTLTQSQMKIHDLSGAMSAAQDVCASSGVPDAIQGGSGAAHTFHSHLASTEAWWPTQYPTAASISTSMAKVEQDTPQALSSDNLFKPPSPASAAYYVGLIARGKPVMNVKDEDVPPAMRPQYLAQKAYWEAMTNLSSDTLNQVAQANAPTMEVTPWISESYQDMGETPPAKLSRRELERVLANRQIASSTWRQALATEDTTGLLRQIALMQAAALQIEDDRLLDADRISALLSGLYSHEVQGEQPLPASALLGKPATTGEQ